MNKNLLFKRACLAAAVSLVPVSQGALADTGVNISGWINEGVTFYDDGDSSDAVQASDNGTTLGSRITFSGSADLPAGLTAGFETILEPLSENTPLIFSNQDAPIIGSNGRTASGNSFDNTTGDILNVLGSNLYFGGFWGKFTFGLQSMPTDNIAVLADPSLTLWSGIGPVFRGNGFTIRDVAPGSGGTSIGGGGAVWGDFLGCLTAPGLRSVGGIGIDCNGIFRNGVRYDLPTFIDGLSIAAGYANDDVYDVAFKYNTTLMGRINTLLYAGYALNAGPFAPGSPFKPYDEAENFQVQFGLMDNVTGLFGSIAYQHEDADATAAGKAVGYEDDTDAFWLKVGVKRKITVLGDTALSFDYGQYMDQFGFVNAGAGVAGGLLDDSEVQRLGVSIDQYFGSKLIIYGKWENLDLDTSLSAAGAAATGGVDPFNGADDLNTFTLGLTYFF